MITFYICRHGQTEFNEQQRLSGWIDTPLTAHGLANIANTAAKVQSVAFDAIYSSDLGRAFITAYTIARSQGFTSEIIRSSALRENGYGDIAGLGAAEAQQRHPSLHKDVNFTPPGGESMQHMQVRVLAFLDELNQATDDQTILIAAHDGVIKSVYANFAHIDLGEHNAGHEYAHDFVASFTVGNGKIMNFQEQK